MNPSSPRLFQPRHLFLCGFFGLLLCLAPSSAQAGDGARFVAETINDNTIFLAGSTFTKTWTLRNTGDTTWDSNYNLRFATGAAMSDHLDIPIVGAVAPNDTYTFSKEMTAPMTVGSAREDWKLVNADGTTIKVNSSNTIYLIIYSAPAPDHSAFGSETIPDNSSHLSGTVLTKSWTVKNKGTTTWNSSYKLRFVSGANLSDHLDIPVVGTVAPNTNYTFTKSMIAPAATGSTTEVWELVNPDGVPFKISNSDTLWILINVISTPFTDWLTSRSLPIQHYQPHADPDRDGHSNLLEYAADTDPMSPASMPDTGIAPSLSGGWEFHTKRLPERTELTYAILSSTDFQYWQPVARSIQGQPTEMLPGEAGTLIETGETPQPVTVRLQVPAAPGNRFYKLAVTAP